jgi:hypothetical protein
MAYKFTIDLTNEEFKAFNLIVPDAEGWMRNVIMNKVRKCFNYVTEAIASDTSLLDPQDQAVISQMVGAEGSMLKSPKDWSKEIKREIVKRTKMKTRVERDQEAHEDQASAARNPKP